MDQIEDIQITSYGKIIGCIHKQVLLDHSDMIKTYVECGDRFDIK